jgi:hypothetical protein
MIVHDNNSIFKYYRKNILPKLLIPKLGGIGQENVETKLFCQNYFSLCGFFVTLWRNEPPRTIELRKAISIKHRRSAKKPHHISNISNIQVPLYEKPRSSYILRGWAHSLYTIVETFRRNSERNPFSGKTKAYISIALWSGLVSRHKPFLKSNKLSDEMWLNYSLNESHIYTQSDDKCVKRLFKKLDFNSGFFMLTIIIIIHARKL